MDQPVSCQTVDVSPASPVTFGPSGQTPTTRRTFGPIGHPLVSTVVQSAALALLAGSLLWPALLAGGILVPVDGVRGVLPWASTAGSASPHNGLLSDVLLQYYPWRRFSYEALRHGAWPLWNPYILAGHPTFASINEQAFYPLNALLAFLPAATSFGWLAWLHLTIAGVGARAFARLHLQDDASACLAGVAFMLGGPVVVWLEYPPFLSTIGWAGLLLYLTERLLRERRPRLAALLGVVIGVQLLGGQTQYSAYLTGLLGAYVVVRLVGLAKIGWEVAASALGLTALAGAIGAGIGAVAYVPAIELLGLTSRSPLDFESALATALPIRNIVTFLLPNAFGSPVRGDFVGFFNYNEATAYVGLLPLLLLALAPIARPRGAAVVTMACVLGLLALLIFGMRPAVWIMWQVSPLRYFGLNRLVILLPLVIGFVAAAVYDRMPATGPGRWRRTGIVIVTVGALAAALLAGILAQAQRPGPGAFAGHDLAVGLVLLVASGTAITTRICLDRWSIVRWLGPIVLAADLLAFGYGYNTISPANPLDGRPFEPLAHSPSGPLAPRTVGVSLQRFVLAPNLGMLWDVPTPDGYVSESVRRYGDFVAHASPVNDDLASSGLFPGGNWLSFGQARRPYLDLLGARYVMSTPDPEIPDIIRSAHDAETGPVAGSHTFGTLFRARQDDLNRIDVYPVTHGRSIPHWIALHLKSAPGATEHLSYIQVEGSTIVNGRPLTFWFKPIADSAGRQFYFYVDSPEAQPGEAISLFFQKGEANGALLLDDQPSTGALAFATYASPSADWRKLAEANETVLYEDPRALARAFVVHEVRSLTDDQFYAGMDDGSFDPARVAAVATPPTLDLATGDSASASETVSIGPGDSVNPDELQARVTLERPGLLVISNVWYPGWSAFVDGTARPVERVDAVFQGVYLPTGPHDVRLVFAPASLRLGLALAGLALVLATAALTIDWLTSRSLSRP